MKEHLYAWVPRRIGGDGWVGAVWAAQKHGESEMRYERAISKISNLLSLDEEGTLRGTGNDDIMEGSDGDDKLYGRKGDDVVIGDGPFADGNGNDRLFGQRGADNLFGDGGNDRLFGGRGRDELSGGDGRDRLFGGRGADELSDGAGRDIMTGGAGRDTFQFSSSSGRNNVVRDFRDDRDRVELNIEGIGIDDLNIRRRGDDVKVTIAGEDVSFILRGARLDQIDEQDFSFADDLM